MDVNNELDYKEMVQKIVNTAGDSGITKILVDMKHVEKLPSYLADGDSGDKESANSDEHQVSYFITLVRMI